MLFRLAIFEDEFENQHCFSRNNLWISNITNHSIRNSI